MHRVISNIQEFYPSLLKLGHLDIEEYDKKISYLAKRYKAISLQECLNYIDKGGHKPRNCFVLTFDDGHHDLYWNAYPILKEKLIPATIFLIAGLIDSSEVTWFDKVEYFILKTKVTEFKVTNLSSKTYYLLSNDDRVNVAIEIEESLKKLNTSDRDAIIEEMKSILEVELNTNKDGNFLLSWKDIMEMSDSAIIDFGSHSMSHAILTNECEEKIEYEISVSKKFIEQKLGKEIFSFAYPNGNFNNLIKSCLKKNGYLCAISTIPGTNNEKTDRLKFRRFAFFDGPLYVFGVKMACFPLLIKGMGQEYMIKKGLYHDT